jgi:hypothetical protein
MAKDGVRSTALRWQRDVRSTGHGVPSALDDVRSPRRYLSSKEADVRVTPIGQKWTSVDLSQLIYK